MPEAKQHVPPEIWAQIIGHARKPTPLPKSRPHRYLLQQPELCALMRVSRLFRSLTEPVLYTHNITDSLPDLINSCRGEGHYSGRPPYRNLRRTKTLHIEYQAKNHDPTYSEIFAGSSGNSFSSGLWRCYGRTPTEAEEASLRQCQVEIEELSDCLTQLARWGMSAVFPNLKTIAVDSIYAHEDDSWTKFEESWNSAEDSIPIQRCTTLFSDWLNSGNLEHLCVRDTNGPLCIEFLTDAKGSGPSSFPVYYTRTLHFGPKADQLAMALGGKIRWISDAPPGTDFADLLLAIGRCCGHLVRSRTMGPAEKDHLGRPISNAEIDIYASTASHGSKLYDNSLEGYGLAPYYLRPDARKGGVQPLSAAKQAAMVAILQEKITALFNGQCKGKDKFRWMVSAETPICEACGSGPPV